MHQSYWLPKFIGLLIFATLMLLIFVPASSFSQEINDAKKVIEKPDRISIAYCVDCVPFHFKDEQGQPAGMLIDIWRLWSQKTGIALDFRAAPWDETLARVGSGVVDAHAGLFFNKERDEFLDYGAALRKTDTHVFIHKSLPTISRLEELSAYRIGVLAEDYVEGYLKKRLPNAIVVPYPDYASIMMALKDGTLRVFAADTLTGIYHLKHSGMVEQFSFTKKLLLYQNDWYAAAKEGNAALIKIINQGMSQISQEEKTEIGRQWTGITKEKKTDALLISMDRAYPPMTFLNNQGNPAGFLVDLWRLWSKKTGLSIRFRENNWKDSLEAIRNGEADVHVGLFKNEERNEWLNFAPEVYRIRTGLYHRAGEKISQDPAQFGKSPLGVIAGSHQETIARSHWPDSQRTLFDSPQELIEALLKGKALAVLEEIPVMDVLLDQMGLRGEIVLNSNRLPVDAVHPAVLKERPEIMALIQQGLSQISQRELGELEKRWIVDPDKRVYANKFHLDNKAVPLDLTLEEKKWLKAHPLIRMGVDRSWPPFEYLDDLGRHTGIAADFFQLIEERLGIRFASPPNISWDEVIAKTKKSELDILSILSPTKEREKFLHFTNPYIQAPFVIVKRTGSASVSDLNDLSGQKVGVVSGYAAEEKVRQDAAHLNIVPAKDFSEGLLALSTGKTDAFVGNLPSVNHFIEELLLSNLEVGASAGFTLKLAIGVRKDWPEFTKILNKAIRSVTEEERRKILRVDEKVGAQETEISLLRVSIVVALLTLVLVGAVFILNRYLKTARAKGLSEDLFQSSKIRRIGVGIIGLFLAVTIILAWMAINHVDQRIRRDIGVTLGIVLKSTQDSLRIWVDNNKRSLAQLIMEPEILEPIEALLSVPRDEDELANNNAQQVLREFFNSRLSTSLNEGFLVISPDFFVIGAHKNDELRLINQISQQDKERVKRALQGEMVFIPPIKSYIKLSDESENKKRSVPAMFFVGPIRNAQDKIIAAVALRIDPFRDFTRLAQGGRIGESGETYAFNQEGYLITESRFKEQTEKLGLISNGQSGILKVRVSDPGGNLMTGFLGSQSINSRPLTLMTQSATTGQSGINIQGYRDYRGVPVLGTWLWDENLELGLATEIDLEEALSPFYVMRNIIVLVLSIIVIFSLVLTALSAWIGEQANLVLRKARDDLEIRIEERTRELQASEEMTRSVITNAMDAVIMIDHENNVLDWNAQAEIVFGWSKEEILGFNVSNYIIPPQFRDLHLKAFKHFLETGEGPILNTRVEITALRKNGEEFPIELTITPSKVGDKYCFTAFCRDITKRIEAENKIIQARVAAEQANQAKSLFISSMSHEIRTPMNAILGYSQILGRDKELKEKQKKGVEAIHRAGKHLLDIINDILDFSKIESGKLELHPHDFDLGSFVQDLLVIFSGKCKEKKLELRSEGVHEGQNIHVHTDAAKLRQILTNLLGNAVKFTESGSVSLRVMPLAGDEFYFEVKDTGQGIPSEKLESIFESFQQDEEGIKKGGTGLGLVIAKKTVLAMGGELEVESEINKGSRFFFSISLPAAKEEVKEKDNKLAGAIGLAQGHSVKAVLIDDNRDNIDVLAATLEEVGVETIEAESGLEGLEKIRESKPDIIFVDYHMPGMDGLEVTRRVQGEHGMNGIKIVMISASTFDHHREQYMKEGVHGFVGKPFIREEVLGIMARLLSLEYEYEITQEGTPAVGDIDFAAVTLPETLHASIKEMASMGMMDELAELLPQVKNSGPNGPGLAVCLQSMVDQFDMDGIIKVMGEVNPG